MPIKSRSSTTEVDCVEREVGVRGNQFADVAAEATGVTAIAADIERFEGADHAVGILGEQSGEQVGDSLAGLAVELPEHAVVERDDHPAGQHAEISRVGIGVEEAELEDLLEQDARACHGDVSRARHPAGGLPSQVVDRHALDELHGDHAGGRKSSNVKGIWAVGFVGELESGSAAWSGARRRNRARV